MRFACAGQAEQGWTSAPHKPLNLSIGDIYRLGLKTQGPSRCLDPAPEPLSTVSCKIVWRGRDLTDLGAKSPVRASASTLRPAARLAKRACPDRPSRSLPPTVFGSRSRYHAPATALP